MIDHRKILKLYIEHVAFMEGTDFLSDSVDGLTSSEQAELYRVGAEACGTTHPQHADRLLRAAAKAGRING